MAVEYNNPFKITTPEGLSAELTVKLFVDVFSEFYNVTDPGNVIIKGPRGVGKSMMFRFLEPDCQCLHKGVSIGELEFVAVYVPLKNTGFAMAELEYFVDKHAYTLINEHLMVVHCLMKVFECLEDDSIIAGIDSTKLYDFYMKDFLRILEIDDPEVVEKTTDAILHRIEEKLETLYRSTNKYLKKCAFKNEIEPYSEELYDYNSYFVPLISRLSKAITNLPNPPTFYLMMDDAHYLSETQTKILNSWIASRVTMKVSLKVSTQYNYKTYYTLNGSTIDTPHDYLDIDIATIYTASKDTYYKRIESIVVKRLEFAGIHVSPQEFFPPDYDQEKAIKKIEDEYIAKYDRGQGRGTNRTDDARRYARPDFIKQLAGSRKSSHTYSYAGFDQLVNISSGVVRTFLQNAHTMYAEQLSRYQNEKRQNPIDHIDATIQSEVVRKSANKILYSDIEAYLIASREGAYPKADVERLTNLIKGLGGLFRTVLISDRSERRVFSIAISDTPSNEVIRILNIGVSLGYFHRSTIGRKEKGSIGRTHLYVLNRMLAPIWNLDPNGFAGYLFLKNSVIEGLIIDPVKTINAYSKSINEDEVSSGVQISLFELNPDIKMGKEIEIYHDQSDS